MAEGDITVYNNAKEQLHLGGWDMDTDNFRLILLGSGYTFNQDGANPAYADTTITSNEITATGYTAAGELMTALTVTQNDAGDYAKWDAGDVTWTSLSTTTIAHAIIYDDSITTPTADPLVLRAEIGTNSNGGNYTISWNIGGIWQLS
jgi:hypothetical protein